MLSVLFFVVVLLATVLVSSTVASDADPLTQRRQILSPCFPDATNVLNATINRQMQIALTKVNRKRRPAGGTGWLTNGTRGIPGVAASPA